MSAPSVLAHRSRRTRFALALPVVLVMSFASAAAGQVCLTGTMQYPTQFPGNFNLDIGQGAWPGLLEAAVGAWSQCAGYGQVMPEIVVNGTGAINFLVEYLGPDPEEDCGEVDYEAAVIRIWGGPGCDAHYLVLAHELGHILGLADSQGDCPDYVMQAAGLGPEQAHADECGKVDENWVTAVEMDCQGVWPVCTPEQNSPIVIDFDGDGFELGSVFVEPVPFDLDADGERELMGWTEVGSDDGFLAWDRNGNRVVDDGSELFGTATPLPGGGVAENGHIALAILDDDGDGFITHRDAAYSQLSIWVDSDHDGVTDPGELRGLARSRVLSVAVGYREVWEFDGHGNRLPFESYAWIAGRGGVRRVPTADVFFLVHDM